MVSYAWVSPTSTTDPFAAWTNDGNAIDGNLATFANASAPDFSPSTPDNPIAGFYTRFLYLNLSTAMWIDRIRFKYGSSTVTGNTICIVAWNADTSAWVTEIVGAILDDGSRHEYIIPPIYTNQLRFVIGHPSVQDDKRMFELDVEQVSGTDEPPIPPEVTVEKIATQDSSLPVIHGSRMRAKHRTTAFKPVVVS